MIRICIALEGLPGSGKTSLKNDLNVSPFSCDRVPQILPDDPDNDTNLTLDDIFYSDVMKSKRFIEGDADITIFDRYYLSTLAYQYAHDKRYGTNFFREASSRYKNAIDKGSIRKPDMTFYIVTPLEQSYQRKGRVPNQDIWTDEGFLAYTKEFYDTQDGLVVLDGSLPYNDIKSIIEERVKERLMH